MTDPRSTDDTPDSRERSARGVLQGYRERRRRRRGEDTYFGSSALLRDSENPLTEQELDSRRSSILEEASRDGVPVELAELLYDIAWDEGLDPAIAYELVRSGLGVAPPADGLTNVSSAPAADPYLPQWMFPPSPPDTLLRERMLRTSFRRLRSILEEEPDVDEALARFAREPDVGHYGY